MTRELLGDEEAMTPVIGIILMVAITVILAAVIASFVLGLGQTSDPAPNPTLEWADNESHVIISITGGDTVEADNIEVQGTSVSEGDLPDAAQNDISSGQTLQAGDEIVLDKTNEDWEVDLIWETPDTDPVIIASQDG